MGVIQVYVLNEIYCIFSCKDEANDQWCDLCQKDQYATNVIFGQKDRLVTVGIIQVYPLNVRLMKDYSGGATHGGLNRS